MENKERMVHVRLAAEVVAALDRTARARNQSRSRFIAEAVLEKLAREQRLLGLRETRGALGPEDGDWAEAPATDWVRRTRLHERENLVWPT
ncbi:MAG: CopG family transcriptional regulator [Moorellales bacterium]